MYKVSMPYIGGILSENSYKWKTRGTKVGVKNWMASLTEKVLDLGIPRAEEYLIEVSGRFWDNRRPDLSNLHKVIGDAVKKGLGVDDKYFSFKDEPVALGYMKQEIEIGIIPIDGKEI